MPPNQYETAEQILDLAHALRADLVGASVERSRVADELMEQQIGRIAEKYSIDSTTVQETEGLVDARIEEELPVIAPEYLTRLLPASERGSETTRAAIESTRDIISGKSERLVVNVGPCSIHDIAGALEYAKFIAEARETYGQHLELIMRFHTEKPRTTVDWKGLTYDPMLTGFIDPENQRPDINLGVIIARMLAVRITDMGVPLSTERLNALTPRYLDGLIALNGIGARNVHNQTSRELTSGLSGVSFFKNAPDGSVVPAAEAQTAAAHSHTFLGIDSKGNVSQVTTNGNPDSVVVLRGSERQANHHEPQVKKALEDIRGVAAKHEVDLPDAIGIDCSHMNSGRDPVASIGVGREIAKQIIQGKDRIVLVMLESYLKSGAQKARPGMTRSEVAYDISITDPCAGRNQTRDVLTALATAVAIKQKRPA